MSPLHLNQCGFSSPAFKKWGFQSRTICLQWWKLLTFRERYNHTRLLLDLNWRMKLSRFKAWLMEIEIRFFSVIKVFKICSWKSWDIREMWLILIIWLWFSSTSHLIKTKHPLNVENPIHCFEVIFTWRFEVYTERWHDFFMYLIGQWPKTMLLKFGSQNHTD